MSILRIKDVEHNPIYDLFVSFPDTMTTDEAIKLVDEKILFIKAEHPDDFAADDLYKELDPLGIKPVPVYTTTEEW